MSSSNDAGHFFQTQSSLDESQRKAQKAKNELGEPIKLSSKILAILGHPHDEAAAFVAESAGTIRLVKLNISKKPSDTIQARIVYRGANAPITSLAVSKNTLYAGSWDKTIHSCSLNDFTPMRRFAGGHSDFVKSVLYTTLKQDLSDDQGERLISGGADGYIVVWNAVLSEKLHILRGHSRGILDLVIQPLPLQQEPSGSKDIVVWSAGSDRTIRKWLVNLNEAKALAFASENGSDEVHEQLIVHDTGVNRLRFYTTPEEYRGPSDTRIILTTASSDKTAKLFDKITPGIYSQPTPALNATLQHPDFVSDNILLPHSSLVVTACRDETVRVWDLEDPEEPLALFDGHFEEVTGLCLRNVEGEELLVSVSIDATIRRWPMSRAGIAKWKLEQSTAEATPGDVQGKIEQDNTVVELTAEEEAELADLMGED